MPAAAQRSRMSPSFQRCVAGVVAHDLDHGLDQVGRGDGAQQCAGHAQAGEGEHLGQALAEAAGGVGVELLQLTGECLEVPGRLVRVWIRPSAAQFAPHPPVLPLRQVVEDPPLLVEAFDGRVDAEPRVVA